MPVMTNENVKPYTGLFGPPRNILLSKWDLLFEKDPKEWIAFKPALGLHVYPCYACRHMFYSKRSFLYHINRRTVVLTYSCPGCTDEQLTFYNRCALLVHARQHFSLQQGTIHLNNLDVSPLPFGLAGFTKDPDIPFLYDEEEQYNDRDVFVNSQFYAAKYEDRGNQIITLIPSNLVINKTFPNGETTALSVLQIAENTPKCQFVLLEHLNRLRRQSRMSEEAEPEVKSEPPEEISENVTNGDVRLPVITKIESLDNSTEQPIVEHPLYKCPECKQQLEESLIDHFMAENRPADMKLKCDECRLICSSQCSFQAHIRIHDELPPFICPDCGQEFHKAKDLKTHMEDICFHSSKSVRYRCPKMKCAKLFASSQTYSTHFALHMETVYKCLTCDRFFKMLEWADEHLAANRDQGDKHTIVQLYECSVCNLGEPFDEIGCKNHIDWHMNDLTKCLYIYLCKYCKSYFRSTATYAPHLVKCSMQNKAKQVVKRKKKPDKPFIASQYESGECKKCKTRIIYEKEKPLDLCRKCIFAENKLSKKNNRPINESEKDDIQLEKTKNPEESSDTEKKRLLLSTQKPVENTDHVQQNGVEMQIQHRKRFRERRPIIINKRIYVPIITDKVICILCKKHLPLSERKPHQRECRYSRPKVMVERFDTSQLNDNLSMTLIPGGHDFDSSSGSWGSSMSRHSFDFSPTRPIKRKRYIKPKRPVVAELEHDLTAEKPIEFDGTYVCRLCDYKQSDRPEFHRHVKAHRQLSTAYQCMECGECFVVKRSLIIHIQHFHNIRDYAKYFEENECFDKEAVKELAKIVKMPQWVRNEVKENQCKVCLQEFTTKEELDKHFRVHGMAFLLEKNKQALIERI